MIFNVSFILLVGGHVDVLSNQTRSSFSFAWENSYVKIALGDLVDMVHLGSMVLCIVFSCLILLMEGHDRFLYNQIKIFSGKTALKLYQVLS